MLTIKMASQLLVKILLPICYLPFHTNFSGNRWQRETSSSLWCWMPRFRMLQVMRRSLTKMCIISDLSSYSTRQFLWDWQLVQYYQFKMQVIFFLSKKWRQTIASLFYQKNSFLSFLMGIFELIIQIHFIYYSRKTCQEMFELEISKKVYL